MISLFKKLSVWIGRLEDRLLGLKKNEDKKDCCGAQEPCCKESTPYPEHPIEGPTKVIEERLAEVAAKVEEKKVTAKEIKSKVKKTPVVEVKPTVKTDSKPKPKRRKPKNNPPKNI